MSDVRQLGIFVDGDWRPAEGGATFESTNPATEEVWARVGAASVNDANAAIESCKRAFREWRDIPREQRADLLDAVATQIYEIQDDLVDAEIADNGSTLRKAGTADIPTCAGAFQYYAQHLRETSDEEAFVEEIPVPSRNLVVQEPFGVVGGIVPWNFPCAAAGWKIAPALAAGNTIVLKPSPYTPVTALLVAEACRDAGIPPGVVNVVPSPHHEVGAAIVDHPDVPKITFTGSTAVGQAIQRAAATHLKSVTLELGGKSPNIILDDADLEVAVRGALFGIFFNAGQACIAGTRVIVPAHLYDTFVEMMVEGARQLVVGDPTDPDTGVGPLAMAPHLEKVQRYVALGLEEGATCATGGRRPPGQGRGYFYEPTIFTGVDNRMRIAQEEVFGPVVCIIPYEGGDEEALRIANDTMYGLASAVWSRDEARALRVARRIEAGTVWINDYQLLNIRFPFEGWKMSGVGRELGRWGYQQYTRTKHIHVGEPGSVEEKYYFELVLPEG